MAFVHLHNHTEFSALDGLTRVQAAPNRAAALGQTAMAITDHDSLSGAYEFTVECLKAGIKPIIGVEFYLAFGSRFERNFETVPNDDETVTDADEGKEKVKRYMHLTVLAKNGAGWKNLLMLHNKAHERTAERDAFWYKPRIDFDLLAEHGDGLIVLTGCLGGPIAGPLARAGRLKNDGDLDGAEAQRVIARANLDILINAVGREHVFLEVMYHHIKAEQYAYMEILALSQETGIPLVATNDCHYEVEEESVAHDGFLAVGASGKSLDEPNRFRFNGSPTYFIRSEEEMLAVLGDTPNAAINESWVAACNNSQLVADLCDDSVIPMTPKGTYYLPQFPLPPGFSDAKSYLDHLVHEGTVEHYGADYLTARPEVEPRISSEIGTITDMGFPDYFLITWDMIAWARSDYTAQDWIDSHGGIDPMPEDRVRKEPILVGVGRGSAAGSVVSYVLKIVGVCPLDNDLLFERFLEPGRDGMPDIDVDFERDRRSEVFQFLGLRWGADKVARIGTTAYALSKAAIKDAARILKPAGSDRDTVRRGNEIKRLGDLLASKVPDGHTFEELDNTSDHSGDAFRTVLAESGQDGENIMRFARSFEGVAKAASIHACGFIISPIPLDELVPMRADRSEKATLEDPRIITWDGPTCEKMGLLKNDVLGLMNLDIVAAALDGIKRNTGLSLTVDQIPDPDTKGDPMVDRAYALIGRGETSGVFQMDGAGMKAVARNVQPNCLTDLSAILALYRPGPLTAGVPDRYADRKHNRAPIDYSIFTKDQVEQEWIASVLAPTQGLFVFQESLMRLGTVMAGFDAEKRSVLRKAVGKKDIDLMAQVGEMLMEGAEQEFHDDDGVLISPRFSRQTVAHMFELMKGSAAYLFNASHSAAYAHLAFTTAYLKANWPVEYGAAILATASKDDKRLAALQSLRADGIVVDAPNVNESLPKTAAVGQMVRIGLSEIKGVGSAGLHVYLDRVKNGPFTSMRNILERVKTPSPDSHNGLARIAVTSVHALIEAGALDDFGPRLGQLMALRAVRGTDVAIPDAQWSVVHSSTRQRFRLGVALGVHPLTAMGPQIGAWRTPNAARERVSPLHVAINGSGTEDRNGSSVMTVGVIAMWEEKGYSGGRRANFTLESSSTHIDGVLWDSTLQGLVKRGEVPRVGDIVAMSGNLKVRVTQVAPPTEGLDEGGDDDVVMAEEVRVPEINANTLYRIRDDKPSILNLMPVNHDLEALFGAVRDIDVVARRKSLKIAQKHAEDPIETSLAVAAPARSRAVKTSVPMPSFPSDEEPDDSVDWDDPEHPPSEFVDAQAVAAPDDIEVPVVLVDSAPGEYPHPHEMNHIYRSKGTRSMPRRVQGLKACFGTPVNDPFKTVKWKEGHVFYRQTNSDGLHVIFMAGSDSDELAQEMIAAINEWDELPKGPYVTGTDGHTWTNFDLLEHRR